MWQVIESMHLTFIVLGTKGPARKRRRSARVRGQSSVLRIANIVWLI